MNIADVARLAGVSQTTVSRVLNNVPTVKEYNRKKVQAAIKQSGFRPNINAQRLAGARKATIGLVIPPYKDLFGSYFVSTILRGVSQAVEDTDYDLLLRITRRRDREDLLKGDILNPEFISGIIFLDLDGNRPLLDEVQKNNIPFIVTNNYFEEGPINCIGVDNRAAAFDIVGYLARLGHKKIATITGRLEIQAGADRLRGYKEALEKNKLAIRKEYILEGDFTRQSAYAAMQKLLRLKDPPTAVFAASDEMALEAIKAMMEQGLKAPDDISVAGFDDNILAEEGLVQLTTMHQPIFEMGQMAAKTLIELINKREEPPVKILLKAVMVERKTCKKPASHS